MATFKIEKAIVKFVGKTVQATDSFKKRDLILTVDGDTDYPQVIKVEAAQAKCDDANLNEVRPGDEVTVHVNLRGREWLNPKNQVTEVFNTLQYWKLDINRTSAGNNSAQPQYAPPANLSNQPGDDDDLPF